MITIGERIGSYRVVRALGSGGMGMVFEAEHEAIRSRAANPSSSSRIAACTDGTETSACFRARRRRR